MKKTGKQIQTDVWKMLKNSSMSRIIKGKVYREGYRPRDSKEEDAVVIFTTGIPTEIEKGVVTINIFVPDRDFYGTGQMLEDGQRTELIEKEAQKWVESLTCNNSEYKFKLRQTIMTDSEPEIHQHFVVVALEYNRYE